MSDLNRTPKTMKDAQLLIRQLREELQNRPDFVVVDEVTNKEVDYRSELPVRLKKRRFKVSARFNGIVWEFNSMEFGSDYIVLNEIKELQLPLKGTCNDD